VIERLSARVIAIIVAAALAVLVVWAAFHFWQKSRSQGAQARVEHEQTQALSNSANDAVATVARSGEASAASEALTRSNEQEIRHAKGADAPVDPAARDAGLRSLCRRAAYRGSERCKLLEPGP
jgi:Flp pilus assembly protein TadB